MPDTTKIDDFNRKILELRQMADNESLDKEMISKVYKEAVQIIIGDK